jgi:GNAT superfamily N-acetyltransferase
MKLRPMTENDLPFADLVRGSVGWNQTLQDWRRFLQLKPNGCVLAEIDGCPAGTAIAFDYSENLAWIGMVLVMPEFRRQGVGTALLGECLNKLQNVRCVKLDATPQGKPLYERLGFKLEWPLARWELAQQSIINKRDTADIPSENVRPVRFTELKEVALCDEDGFGENRFELLESLMKCSTTTAAWQHADSQLQGFGLMREGSRADYLGPVVAREAAVGEALVSSLLIQTRRPDVYWDIPDLNSAATALATRLGFQRQRTLYRMFRGENNSPGDPHKYFAIADPALG